MRSEFIKMLCDEREKTDNIFLLTGDLGWNVLDNFEEKFPNSYINIGVAEQNMIGVAAGLAYSGFKVFAYSIANFPSFRCLEQIRNDVSYHKLDVNIISVGSGFSYGSLGYSHHAVEDISAIRSLPHIKIFNPGTIIEAEWAFQKIISEGGPSYVRIHKSSKFDLPIPNKSIYDEQGFFEYGESSEIALLSSGTMLEEVLIASKYLKNRGIRTTTISFPQIKPISNLETLSRFSHLVCIEEHSSRGGFGSSILEELSNLSLFPKIKIIGTNDDHYGVIGSESYLRSVHELDAISLADRIEKWLSAN